MLRRQAPAVSARDIARAPKSLTPEIRARLEALLPELRPLLDGQGASREWIVERTGIIGKLVTHWLVEIGAKPSAKGWRFPNVKRLRDSLNSKASHYAAG